MPQELNAAMAFGGPDLVHTASTLAEIVAIALLLAWSSNLYNFMDGNDGLLPREVCLLSNSSL